MSLILWSKEIAFFQRYVNLRDLNALTHTHTPTHTHTHAHTRTHTRAVTHINANSSLISLKFAWEHLSKTETWEIFYSKPNWKKEEYIKQQVGWCRRHARHLHLYWVRCECHLRTVNVADRSDRDKLISSHCFVKIAFSSSTAGHALINWWAEGAPSADVHMDQTRMHTSQSRLE